LDQACLSPQGGSCHIRCIEATMASPEFDALLAQLQQAHVQQVKELEARLESHVASCCTCGEVCIANHSELVSKVGERETARQSARTWSGKPRHSHAIAMQPLKSTSSSASAPLAQVPVTANGARVSTSSRMTITAGDSTFAPASSSNSATPSKQTSMTVSYSKDSAMAIQGSMATYSKISAAASHGSLGALSESSSDSAAPCSQLKAGRTPPALLPPFLQERSKDVDSNSLPLTPSGRRRVLLFGKHHSKPSTSSPGPSATESQNMRRLSAVMAEFNRGGQTTPSSGLWPFHIITNSSLFELFVGTLVLVNAFSFALEVQISGWDNGVQYGYLQRGQSLGNKAPWNVLLSITGVLGTIIGAVTVAEVCVRILGMGHRKWAADAWNWFDCAIVTCWLLEVVGGVMDVPMNSRALRSFRLLRVLRVLRFLQAGRLFDSLYFLNAALKRSVGVLFWSLLYLMVVQVSLALLLTELMQLYLENTVFPHEDREQVFMYFGTFSRSTLTMFEMTLANWPTACRVMTANISEWWIVFALAHKLTLGFGIIGIINGAVMQETFKAASRDKDVLVRDRQRLIKKESGQLRQIFEVCNLERDGLLNEDEFILMCQTPEIANWFASIGLKTKNPSQVFRLMDDGLGSLTADQLVEGVHKLKGDATGLDLRLSEQAIHDLLDATREKSSILQALDKRVQEQTKLLHGLAADPTSPAFNNVAQWMCSNDTAETLHAVLPIGDKMLNV